MHTKSSIRKMLATRKRNQAEKLLKVEKNIQKRLDKQKENAGASKNQDTNGNPNLLPLVYEGKHNSTPEEFARYVVEAWKRLHQDS